MNKDIDMKKKWYNIPGTTILIPETVEVSVGSSNIKYYLEKDYKLPYKKNKWGKLTIPWGSKITVNAKDLPEKCGQKFPCKCKVCGNTKDKFLQPWFSSLSKINNDRGCPKCNGKQMHTIEEIIEVAKLSNVIITSPEKNYYKLEDKIELKCIKCGNNHNKNNKKWNVTIANFLNRKNLCPKCYNLQTMSRKEVLNLLNEKNMKPLSSLPDNIVATYKINVQCTICGNKLDRFSKNQWKVDLNHLKSQDVGCPKCKNMQTMSDIDFITFLEEKNISLIKRGAGSFAKNKLKCNICNTVFDQSYDSLRTNKRSCQCEKYTWYAFEELIGNYFGGKKNIKINNAIPDRFFKQYGIILEIKFGKTSINNRAYKQSQKYLKSGYKVIYVINAYRSEINEEFLIDGIDYFFLENFSKINIDNKYLTKEIIKTAKDMHKNPYKYSKKSQPVYYESIKEIFIKFCKENDRLPSSNELKLLGIDFSTIKRAYGLSPNSKIKQLADVTGYKNIGIRSGANHQQSINILVINKNGKIITKDSMQGICNYFNKSITWVSSNMIKGNGRYFFHDDYVIIKEEYINQIQLDEIIKRG